MYFRKSTQTIQRAYPHLDGQRFHANRGRLVTGTGGRPVYVPLEGYWREATCQEVRCTHWERGFTVTLDLGPAQPAHDLAMNQARAKYIREQSGRSCTERWEGSVVIYVFPAEQKCFRQHRLPVPRDPQFIHVAGAGRSTNVVDYDEFFDRFNETSYQLGRRRQNG